MKLSEGENLRFHGDPPYRVAVLHGGPGAAGSVAPVARELSKHFGVLEPFQTGMTIAEQINEVQEAISTHGESPVILIGHSWGAWLGYMVAAMAPAMVKKLVLISAGPFSEDYVKIMTETRWNRLTDGDREQMERLQKQLTEASDDEQRKLFSEFGRIMSRVDAYEPVLQTDDPVTFRPDIYNAVMPEAAALRSSGELLAMGHGIVCPVAVIHGDYDPHPYPGVQEPLARVFKEFQWFLLERCGHHPWEEKYARDRFYRILVEVVGGK